MENVQVLIIGAGMGGVSAAIWCKRLGLQAVLIEQGHQLGGQLKQIKSEIWDYPPNTFKNGEELLIELEKNIAATQIDCRLTETLIEIDATNHVVTTTKQAYRADYLILATGLRPNSLDILEDSSIVLAPGFSTTSQGHLLTNKNVLIIGGGDRAVESGYNLSSHAHHIWLAVRRRKLRARPDWVERLLNCKNVSILYQTEIIGTVEDKNSSTGAWLQAVGADQPYFLALDWILPRIGVKGSPMKGSLFVLDQAGFVRVNKHQLTNHEWIYAIGDIANGAAYASLALASGQAMKAAKHISLRLKEK